MSGAYEIDAQAVLSQAKTLGSYADMTLTDSWPFVDECQSSVAAGAVADLREWFKAAWVGLGCGVVALSQGASEAAETLQGADSDVSNAAATLNSASGTYVF